LADLLEIPPARLSAEVLAALLEEFASRDGTDYGDRELSLAAKVQQLRAQLDSGELALLYDGDSEAWDLLPRDSASVLLSGGVLS